MGHHTSGIVNPGMAMENIASLLFLLWFGIPIGGYLYLTWRVQTVLRDQHAEIWSALGSPQIQTFSPVALNRFLRYMWTKEASCTPDVVMRPLVLLWRTGSND